MIKIDEKLENVRIINTGNLFGKMDMVASIYPRKMNIEKRKKDFLRRRLALAEKRDFDGNKMFKANQSRRDGSYCVITKELIEKEEDAWLNEIEEDILIITDDNPGIVIGHPIADFPVIIMTDRDNGATAIGYCSGEMINLELPIKIANSLISEFGTKREKIKTYVSSCIGKNWQFDHWPPFATNRELWENSISVNQLDDGQIYYCVDIRRAISEQLDRALIKRENIHWNMDDTFKDDNYYSNSASKMNSKKLGRNYVGAYYSENDTKKLVKRI